MSEKHCKPCEGGVLPLTETDALAQLKKLHTSWEFSSNKTAITRHFQFRGFSKVMQFVNAVADIAKVEKHHPDVCFGYNYCDITLTTHSAGGITENDFIMAAKIDAVATA